MGPITAKETWRPNRPFYKGRPYKYTYTQLGVTKHYVLVAKEDGFTPYFVPHLFENMTPTKWFVRPSQVDNCELMPGDTAAVLYGNGEFTNNRDGIVPLASLVVDTTEKATMIGESVPVYDNDSIQTIQILPLVNFNEPEIERCWIVRTYPIQMYLYLVTDIIRFKVQVIGLMQNEVIVATNTHAIQVYFNKYASSDVTYVGSGITPSTTSTYATFSIPDLIADYEVKFEKILDKINITCSQI